jgi:phage baseplate assembly protein W
MPFNLCIEMKPQNLRQVAQLHGIRQEVTYIIDTALGTFRRQP